MSELDKTLNKTRKSLFQACNELGIEYSESIHLNVQECSSCGTWVYLTSVKVDLDGNPICNQCFTYYGP